MLAYEAGYRYEPSSTLTFDLSTFYNNYSHYRSFETVEAPYLSMTPYPHIVAPVVVDNLTHAHTYGGEVVANWQATNRLRFTAEYSLLRIFLGKDKGSNSDLTQSYEGNDPRNQLSLRASVDLPHALELIPRSIASASSQTSDNPIPGYDRLDIRLGWRPRSNLDVSLGVQNLLGGPHREILHDPAGDTH